MNRLRRNIRQEEGSTSVLIVIMMIVLMAFGMAALTTSYASYRMAIKSSTFSDEYNLLDSNATQVEYDICLLIENLSDQIKKESTTLDKRVYNDYMNSAGSALILDYLRESQSFLVNAAYEQDEISSYAAQKGRIGTLRYTISIDGDKPKNLTVKLNLFAPPLLGYNSYKEFVEVVEWYEWQESISNEGEIFFDDLFDENNSFDENNTIDENSILDENP